MNLNADSAEVWFALGITDRLYRSCAENQLQRHPSFTPIKTFAISAKMVILWECCQIAKSSILCKIVFCKLWILRGSDQRKRRGRAPKLHWATCPLSIDRKE